MAAVTLYSNEHFTGNSHTWTTTDATLKNDDFPGIFTGSWNNKTSSFIITSGHWVLYEDDNHKGTHTKVLGPGFYDLHPDHPGVISFASIGIHNDQISSLLLWS